MLVPATALCQDHSQVNPSLHRKARPPAGCLGDTTMPEGNEPVEPHTHQAPTFSKQESDFGCKFHSPSIFKHEQNPAAPNSAFSSGPQYTESGNI